MWTKDDVRMMSLMVGQTNAFGNNESDEIKIDREDGSRQGILKTWALPIIPLLDSGCVKKLYEIWPKLTTGKNGNFFNELNQLCIHGNENAAEIIGEIKKWNNRAVNNPQWLKRSLERTRLYSWLLDKRMTASFSAKPLPARLDDKIPELVNRLFLALGLMNPFYNLEVIVGNPQLGLRADYSLKSSVAGILDLVAFLIPAAFRDIIVADCQNWNGLNWELLREQTKKLLIGDKIRKRIILNISRIAGIPPHHVLFAANSLEWIPTRVGGKKSDHISTKEATERLDEALFNARSEADDVISVASEINAHIRFLNWVPLIEDDMNFSGKNWTYASACDTADELFNTLCLNPHVWKNEFKEVFEQNLAPKLKNLDVASAKGRFLLHIIQKEERLKKEYCDSKNISAWDKHSVSLFVDNVEPIFLTEIQNNSQVGGKSFGLMLAASILPEQTLTDGIVLSSSYISSLLRENGLIWKKIVQMDWKENIAVKMTIAKEVEHLIANLSVPKRFCDIVEIGLDKFSSFDLWAVRSSSLDEGEARGVYQTFLRVDKKNIISAILHCVASYYSKNAVHFRAIIGAGDIPDFAVLIQPYKHAKGGVGSISDGKYTISTGSTPDKVTSGNKILEETNGKTGYDDRLSPLSSKVIDILTELSEFFGNIQIEWFANRKGNINLLQMEVLPSSAEKAETANNRPSREISMQSLEQIGEVERYLSETNDNIDMKLSEAIDLDSFHGEFLGLVARFGKRISKIQTQKPISPSSHFANICRYFGVQLI